MALLALRHHPRAKEPGWGFLAPWRCCPSYCALPAASLPRQTHQAGLWPCPPLPGQLMSLSAGHVPLEPLCPVSAWPHPDPGLCESLDSSCPPALCQHLTEASQAPQGGSSTLHSTLDFCSLLRPSKKVKFCLSFLFPSMVRVPTHPASCRSVCHSMVESMVGPGLCQRVAGDADCHQLLPAPHFLSALPSS